MDPQSLLNVLRRLESIPLDYMVTGSIAAILYGKPRLTHDMDVVLVFPPYRIASFQKKFPIEEFYCPPREALESALAQGDSGHFNLVDQKLGFKIDIYPFGEEPLVSWGLEHKRRIELLINEPIWVAPPEYVIVKKMLFYREGQSEKHLEDIRAMLEVSGPEINHPLLESWLLKLNLMKLWQKVKI